MSVWQQAEAMARDWVAVWNCRDLEAVLAQYGADVEICSPLGVERLGRKDGILPGKDALWFDDEDVRVEVNAVTLFYARESGWRMADTIDMTSDRRMGRVGACYAG